MMKTILKLALLLVSASSSFAQTTQQLDAFVGVYKIADFGNGASKIYTVSRVGNVLSATTTIEDLQEPANPSSVSQDFVFDKIGAPAQSWRQADSWSSFGDQYKITTSQKYNEATNKLVSIRVEHLFTFGFVPGWHRTSTWSYFLENSGNTLKIQHSIDAFRIETDEVTAVRVK